MAHIHRANRTAGNPYQHSLEIPMAAPSDTTARLLRGESAGTPPVQAEGLDRSADVDQRAHAPEIMNRTPMEKFLRNLLQALSTWPT